MSRLSSSMFSSKGSRRSEAWTTPHAVDLDHDRAIIGRTSAPGSSAASVHFDKAMPPLCDERLFAPTLRPEASSTASHCETPSPCRAAQYLTDRSVRPCGVAWKSHRYGRPSDRCLGRVAPVGASQCVRSDRARVAGLGWLSRTRGAAWAPADLGRPRDDRLGGGRGGPSCARPRPRGTATSLHNLPRVGCVKAARDGLPAAAIPNEGDGQWQHPQESELAKNPPLR